MADDLAVLERQLGRRPRAFRRVAVRCPFGRPAVVEQTPFDDCGAPFPTTYWLSCRQLVVKVSRLEAGGGVERWTRAVHSEPDLARSVESAHAEQRRLRPELDVGVGGARSGAAGLKCLHAHVAFGLAQPGYELADRILEELEPLWPTECCSGFPSELSPSG